MAKTIRELVPLGPWWLVASGCRAKRDSLPPTTKPNEPLRSLLTIGAGVMWRGGYPRRPMGTIVYIDGFNLYYGAVKGTRYKWLDLEALCRRLLPKDNIAQIRYFTAQVSARRRPTATSTSADLPSSTQEPGPGIGPLRALPHPCGAYASRESRPGSSAHSRSCEDRRERLGRESGVASAAGRLPPDMRCGGRDFKRLRPPSADTDRRAGAWDQSRHHQPATTQVPKPCPDWHLLQTTSTFDPGRLPATASDA